MGRRYPPLPWVRNTLMGTGKISAGRWTENEGIDLHSGLFRRATLIRCWEWANDIIPDVVREVQAHRPGINPLHRHGFSGLMMDRARNYRLGERARFDLPEWHSVREVAEIAAQGKVKIDAIDMARATEKATRAQIKPHTPGVYIRATPNTDYFYVGSAGCLLSRTQGKESFVKLYFVTETKGSAEILENVIHDALQNVFKAKSLRERGKGAYAHPEGWRVARSARFHDTVRYCFRATVLGLVGEVDGK